PESGGGHLAPGFSKKKGGLDSIRNGQVLSKVLVTGSHGATPAAKLGCRGSLPRAQGALRHFPKGACLRRACAPSPPRGGQAGARPGPRRSLLAAGRPKDQHPVILVDRMVC